MSHCPDCGAKLEQRRGDRFTKTLYEGKSYEQKISGYYVKWYCPKCKKIKPHSSAELAATGAINRICRGRKAH